MPVQGPIQTDVPKFSTGFRWHFIWQMLLNGTLYFVLSFCNCLRSRSINKPHPGAINIAKGLSIFHGECVFQFAML